MVSPHVRVMGDVAVVTYIRLTQRMGDGGATTAGHQETRVWQRRDGRWRHVHFHRSPLPTPTT
jgi:calcium/calmodulin-dependent protein kinase (CaM kinase) II